MQRKKLHPKKIMTTSDFPVHNGHILKIYFKICRDGHPEILPPCPVLHKSIGLPLLNSDDESAKSYNASLRQYFDDNPHVEYILCDGSHKTTAWMLSNNPIDVLVLESDDDIKEMRDLIEKGDMFSFAGLDTIDEIIDDLARHHSKTSLFWTVEDKTRRMVKERVIPDYMIEFYSHR